jgi:hypothetical protein
MNHRHKDDKRHGNKVVVNLSGTVDKIIPAVTPAIGHSRPEMVEIAVEGAAALYREIRVDNTLHDEQGNEVRLKLGAEVEVTIAATSEVSLPHKNTYPLEVDQPTQAAHKKKTS